MVRMDHDIDRFLCGECRDERGIDPSRIDYRHPRVKPDDAEMRHLIEGVHDLPKPTRRQKQRVAAGDNHLPDLRALAYVVEGTIERRLIEYGGFLADDFPTEAKAAIDRAQQNWFQQYSVRITVNDAGNGRPTLVADGVATFLRRCGKLRDVRHKLRRDRVIGVARVDQLGDVVGHRDGELCGDPPYLFESLRFDQSGADETVSADNRPPCTVGHDIGSLSLIIAVSNRAQPPRLGDAPTRCRIL